MLACSLACVLACLLACSLACELASLRARELASLRACLLARSLADACLLSSVRFASPPDCRSLVPPSSLPPLPNFRPVVCIQIVTSRHGVSWHVMRHVRYMFSGAGAARAVAPGGADTTWAGTWFDGLGSVVIEEDGDTLIASEVRRFGGSEVRRSGCCCCCMPGGGVPFWWVPFWCCRPPPNAFCCSQRQCRRHDGGRCRARRLVRTMTPDLTSASSNDDDLSDVVCCVLLCDPRDVYAMLLRARARARGCCWLLLRLLLLLSVCLSSVCLSVCLRRCRTRVAGGPWAGSSWATRCVMVCHGVSRTVGGLIVGDAVRPLPSALLSCCFYHRPPSVT